MSRTLVDFDAIARWERATDALAPSADDRLAMAFLGTGTEPVEYTRAGFVREVRRHAHALRAAGIGPGDLVIVAHEDMERVVFTFWGLVFLGAIPSIYTTPNERLFPEIYMANLAALIKEVDAHALLASDALAEAIAPRLGCPVTGIGTIESKLPAEPDPSLAPHAAKPADLAYLQTSSGTTGSQRCVPTTHGMLLAQVAMFARRMEVGPDDVVVNWMPLYHDGGLIFGAVLPFACEVPCLMISPLDWVRHPVIMFRAISDYGGTLANMPNFAFNHLARRVRERDAEGISLASMRLFANGSERVYHTSFDRFVERFAPLGVRREQCGVAYGMAENTLMVSHTLVGTAPNYDAIDRDGLELEQRATPLAAGDPRAVINVSCGPPLDGIAIRILDDQDQDLPERRVGQVAIKSPSLFAGYHRRPELTPQLFRGEWFLTGDMGYIANGELYVVGRLKDLIINGGKNIYPADLEEIVAAVPGVRPGRAAVFGVPDEAEGTELIAVVVESDTEDPEEKAELGRRIRKALTQETALTISYLDVLSERWVIKTSSGKTSRVACRRKWLETLHPPSS